MASLISLPLSFLRRISRMRIPGLARGIVAPSLPATPHAQSAQDNEVRFTRTPRLSGTSTRGLRISGHLAILAAGCLAMQGVFAHSSSSLTGHHNDSDASLSQPYGFKRVLSHDGRSGALGLGGFGRRGPSSRITGAATIWTASTPKTPPSAYPPARIAPATPPRRASTKPSPFPVAFGITRRHPGPTREAKSLAFISRVPVPTAAILK